MRARLLLVLAFVVALALPDVAVALPACAVALVLVCAARSGR